MDKSTYNAFLLVIYTVIVIVIGLTGNFDKFFKTEVIGGIIIIMSIVYE